MSIKYVPESEYLTIQEIEEQYNISYRTVLMWALRGKIKNYYDEDGKRYFEPLDNVEMYHKLHTNKRTQREQSQKKETEERIAQGLPTVEDMFTDEQKTYLPRAELCTKYNVYDQLLFAWVKQKKVKFVYNNNGDILYEPLDDNIAYLKYLANKNFTVDEYTKVKIPRFSDDVYEWNLKKDVFKSEDNSTPLTSNRTALHPFMPDDEELSDKEVDEKVIELTQKYFMTTDPYIQYQISMLLESFKEIQSQRKEIYWKKVSANKGIDGRSYDLNKIIDVQKPS